MASGSVSSDPTRSCKPSAAAARSRTSVATAMSTVDSGEPPSLTLATVTPGVAF